MKIAFTSTYSYPSISGVWNRVENMALELIRRGHEVCTFTSNLKAGTDEILEPYEEYKGIHIYRYGVKHKISKNASFWDYKELKKDILRIRPDIIDCQTYRHPESNFMLKLAKKNEIKIFLTTHAPFNVERNWKLRLFTKLYDLFYKNILNKFDKVIAITKWEIPYLLRLGCKQENILFIPNSLPEEFYQNPRRDGDGILFLGRIAPVKDLETLDSALENLEIKATAIGPTEKNYKPKFRNIKIDSPVYDLKEKIAEIDKCEIFVLPSKREAMPYSIIEAMARGRMVIASETDGAKELIEHGKNGFLFPIRDSFELRTLLILAKTLHPYQKEMIRNEAIKKSGEFAISNQMNKWEEIWKTQNIK